MPERPNEETGGHDGIAQSDRLVPVAKLEAADAPGKWYKFRAKGSANHFVIVSSCLPGSTICYVKNVLIPNICVLALCLVCFTLRQTHPLPQLVRSMLLFAACPGASQLEELALRIHNFASRELLGSGP
jgi:hypothetical protein